MVLYNKKTDFILFGSIDYVHRKRTYLLLFKN